MRAFTSPDASTKVQDYSHFFNLLDLSTNQEMMMRGLKRMMVGMMVMMVRVMMVMVMMLRWVLPLIHICGTHSASCSDSHLLRPSKAQTQTQTQTHTQTHLHGLIYANTHLHKHTNGDTHCAKVKSVEPHKHNLLCVSQSSLADEIV